MNSWWIDTDPGVDDAWALLMMLASAADRVVGVSVVGGNVGLNHTLANACRVIDRSPYAVLVHVGAAQPLIGGLPDAGFVHGGDGFGNSQLPIARTQPEALPAALQLKLSYRPLDPLAGDAGYYRERLWNQQLAAYAGRLPDTHFLFPVGPLRYLRWLTELAPQPLLLLAADKGYDYVEQIRSYQNLALTQHGGFSLPVNFHAIAELAGADGFTVLRGPRRESQLKILGLFRGLRDRGVETALAFAEQIGRTHPSDRHRVLKQAVMPAMEQPLGYLLSLLRLSQAASRMLRATS